MSRSLATLAVVASLVVGCRIDFAPLDAAADGALDAIERPLVDRGVLVRYFLDQAQGGQSATLAHDSIAPALDLPMRYDAADDPVWFEAATGRGLSFPAIELDGGACTSIQGTKVLSGLSGSATGTIEVVADLTAGSSSGSRLLHVGFDAEWAFSLGFSTVLTPTAVWFGGQFATTVVPANAFRFWPLDVAALGRTVLTLVYDAREAAEDDRTRLYVNGALTPLDPMRSELTLVANDAIALRAEEDLCVGNRFIGKRTPVGTISYAALYTSALTPAEVQANAARLASWDDR